MKTLMVAGQPLPEAIAEALHRGKWPAAVRSDRLEAVFGEAPEQSWTLYTLDEMEGETYRWTSERDPAYLGQASEALDPERSILIGDLGIDRPIAVDLRSHPPSIRFLTMDGRWVQVAPTAEALLERLGLV